VPMYCMSCGVKLTDPQQFCPDCGARLIPLQSPPAQLWIGDITAPGRELNSRFKSLGNMSGKTINEIVAVVGTPSSRSSMAFGQTLFQWQATGCHVALLFDQDNRFVSIQHEYAQYAPPPAFSGLNLFLGVVIGT
jgi:hypothetical protein